MIEQAPDLPLAVVGVDFRDASTRYRAALTLAEEERSQLAKALEVVGGDGLVVVETCNRTEWIVAARDPSWCGQLLASQMIERWLRADLGPDLPAPKVRVGDEAARHVLRLAVGLESLVQGEREIAGQLGKALKSSREDGRSTAELNILASSVGRVSRKVQRNAPLHGRAVGVHSLAVGVLCHHLDPATDAVVLVGLGSIGRKVEESLRYHGFRFTSCNRSERPGAEPLSELPRLLRDAAGVVLATGAPSPVLRLEHLAERLDDPLLVVDIGSPPQCAETVRARSEVEVLGIDDLVGHHTDRAGAERFARAETFVEAELAHYKSRIAKHRLRSLLDDNQRSLRDVLDHELPATLAEHLPTLDPRARHELEVALRALIRKQAHVVHEALERLQTEDP